MEVPGDALPIPEQVELGVGGPERHLAALPGHGVADRPAEGVGVDLALRQVVLGPTLDRFDGGLGVVESGHDHDRTAGSLLRQHIDRDQTDRVGEAEIEEDAIEVAVVEALDRGAELGHPDDLELSGPVGREGLDHAAGVELVVLDDEDADLRDPLVHGPGRTASDSQNSRMVATARSQSPSWVGLVT